MKTLTLFLLSLLMITSLHANCDQKNTKRLVKQSIKELQSKITLPIHSQSAIEMDQCDGLWLHSSEANLDLYKTAAFKLECGIRLEFDNADDLYNYVVALTEITRNQDHYVAFDFLADVAVPICATFN